jgi:hypothetical protein
MSETIITKVKIEKTEMPLLDKLDIHTRYKLEAFYRPDYRTYAIRCTLKRRGRKTVCSWVGCIMPVEMNDFNRFTQLIREAIGLVEVAPCQE